MWVEIGKRRRRSGAEDANDSKASDTVRRCLHYSRTIVNHLYTQTFPRLAFVDLETTGGNANQDRITEIGIIEVDQDGVREWSSLVNPLTPIPPFIQSLTGISDDMVQEAPTFGQLADDIVARLADRIFIAHNARFDYTALRNEFRRIGRDFRPSMLCTVRLSRKLFPGFERHNLDSLTERHQLRVTERHRALGDAQLIWQFWQKIHQTHSAEAIGETLQKLLVEPGLPSRLDALGIETMPSTPGVYLLYGAGAVPLYVGKAGKLRQRVLAHFSAKNAVARERHLSQETERIEWIETGGEIGALLQEVRLIKQLMPVYNRNAHDDKEVCAWRLLSRNGQLKATLAYADDLFFAYDPELYGLYGNPGKAADALRAIAAAHGLCLAALGLEKPRGGKGCSARRAGTCLGACVGQESLEEHNARAREALQSVRLQAWPYPGPIGIREAGIVHVIEGWAYLGCGRSGEDIMALLAKGQQRFDRDVYQILQKRLPELTDQITVL